MNALQPQRDPNASRPSQQQMRRDQLRQARQLRRARQTQQSRPSPHRALVVETSIKLAVNVALAGTALSTLLHLIPYNNKQQSDLQQLQAEVTATNAKVEALQSDFNHHFDPQETLNVMQEQNIRFNPKQRQVVWLSPAFKPDRSSANGTQQANSSAPD